MAIKTMAQTVLASILSTQTAAAVDVVSGANTASGVTTNVSSQAALEDIGEAGQVDGAVYCNADTLGALTLGQSITVDGDAATVMRSVVDPAGAIVKIEYQLQKPK